MARLMTVADIVARRIGSGIESFDSGAAGPGGSRGLAGQIGAGTAAVPDPVGAETYVTSATLRCWLHRFNAVGVDGLGSRSALGAGSGSPRHSGRPSSPWPTRNRPGGWRATEPGSCRLPMSVRRRSRPGTPGPGGPGCRHRRGAQPGPADLTGREDAVAADPQLGYEHRPGVRPPKDPRRGVLYRPAVRLHGDLR